MSMLKYVLAFFAFILVTLAPVYADEGYIPFFPDFMEPHGIGFRGPARNQGDLCWTSHSDCGDSHKPGMPFSSGTSNVRSSPIILEYRKNYLFKKLFYLQTLTDFGSVITNQVLGYKELSGNDFEYSHNDFVTDPFFKDFITPEEKTIF